MPAGFCLSQQSSQGRKGVRKSVTMLAHRLQGHLLVSLMGLAAVIAAVLS